MAFPLHPETPEQGKSLEELFAGRDIDIPAVMDRLRGTAAKLNLPWGDRHMTYNSRRSTELGKWAEEAGRGHEFHLAVFQAYFARGLNIADFSVLKEICRDLNLDPVEAERVLVEGVYREAVDRDWAYSQRLGIRAVPTFLAAGQALVGAQSHEALEKLVLRAREQKKAPSGPLPMA